MQNSIGGTCMVNYNRLWKLLIDKNMNKGDLRELTGLSSSTIAKMTNQEMVSMKVIEKICDKLDCNIEDVIFFEK